MKADSHSPYRKTIKNDSLIFENIPGSLNEILSDSVRDNWARIAFSDFGSQQNHTFADVAETVAKLHIIFDAAGVAVGDKVAICGKNSSNWAITFIACLAYGAVAVPILHEFKPDTVHHLVDHSDAKLLFVDEAIWDKLDHEELPSLVAAIYISEKGMPYCNSEKLANVRDNIDKYFASKYPHGFSKNDVHWHHDAPDELSLINYTSGSTGMSKGVMLPYRSIWSNIVFSMEHLTFLLPGDGVVNMLPLAHLYGMSFEMLHPFVKGCHCNFLTKTPSPSVLLKAFSEIKPKLIIAVPLVLEKIIKSKVFPVIEKQPIKTLLKIPVARGYVLSKIRTQLMQALGGNLKEFIIGGAALNADIEKLLNAMHFPYTVGYGMTECGPLITYEPPKTQRPGSVGKLVDRMEMKIDSPDPETIPGDLWVKGANVMQGYYKNPEATAEVMKDGWMNTGDMCTIDKDGYIHIMGRSKTMILGPSGQNIYPEEIEQKINNLPYVVESVVIDDGGKLVALVYPDFDSLKKDGKEASAVMDEDLRQLNPQLPAYSKISEIRIFNEEFEKTPKRSIKRFLYQK